MNFQLLTADQLLFLVKQRSIARSKTIQVHTTGPRHCPILISPQVGAGNVLPCVSAKFDSSIGEDWCEEFRQLALRLPEVGWTSVVQNPADDFYWVQICVPQHWQGETPLHLVMLMLIYQLEQRGMIVKEDCP